MADPALIEDVRRAILGAGLKGCFWLRREGNAVRLTIRWEDSRDRVLRAVKGAFEVGAVSGSDDFLVSRHPPGGVRRA